MNPNTPHSTHHPRVPIGLVAAAAIAVCLLIGGILAWIAWNMAIELRIFIGALFAGAVAWLYAAVVVYVRRNQPRYIDREYDTQQILAHRSQGLPASITSLNYHDSHKDIPMQLPPPVIEGEIVRTPVIPTFAQLLDAGSIGPNKPLILGYNADSGEALTGDWERLYSCGVGGMTGSGKSWVIAFLAGQSAAAGARIILIDPHAGDPESLSNRLAGLSPSFMCDVASNGSAIESALKLASSKLDNRRAGRGGNWPILLICDEWTSMLRGKLGDLLTATALDFAEQGRKYGCFAILGAQAWQVDAAGEVRDRLASHYILRTRGDQFRYQTGLRSGAAPDDTLTLPPGQAYLLNTRGELVKVQIPQMTHADILRLGTLVDQPARSTPAMGFQLAPTQALTPITASAVANGKATGRQPEGKSDLPSTATQTARTISPEAARAASLFLDGKSPQEIATELRGVSSSVGGRKYQAALAEVFELIRQGVQS